ncbi:MAG: ATP synthase F0 subunit C [Ruminococcus sp.]|nr:ATP synthase F0 subunit C [Ruminococcus sp.]
MLIFVAGDKNTSAMGAAVAVLTGVGAGVGIGLATSRACDAIARQPEAKKDIRSTMLIGCALAEATAIYGLLVSIMLIFVA